MDNSLKPENGNFFRRFSIFPGQRSTVSEENIEHVEGEEEEETEQNNKQPQANEKLAEKRHQEILAESKQSLTHPIGVLAIHIKEVRFTNLNPTGAIDRNDVTVYIKTSIGRQIKCSTAYDGVTTPASIVFDDLKHFLLQISPKREDPMGYLRFEVIAFEKDQPGKHYIVGLKQMHIYDVIKKLYIVDTIDIYHVGKPVATMELEFCFAYGAFGYGYSNQFDNRQKSPKDQLQHSMFWREEPPVDRLDWFRHLMTARPVGQPAFINFNSNVDVGDIMRQYKSEMSLYDWQTIEEPTLVISRMKGRMNELQNEYNQQLSRKDRLKYLRDLVHNHVTPSDIKKGVIEIPKSFKLRRRQYGTKKPTEEAGHESGSRDMSAMKDVIQQAPGIQPNAPVTDTQEGGAAGFFSRVFGRSSTGGDKQQQQQQQPQQDQSLFSTLRHRLSRIPGSKPVESAKKPLPTLIEPHSSQQSLPTPSVLESAAVRIRQMASKDNLVPDTPRVMLRPATPELSDSESREGDR